MNWKLEAWRNAYRRVLGMGPRELADRLRQKTAARLDFLRYKAGLTFEPRQSRNASSRKPAHFFFSSDTTPALCSRLCEKFPEQATSTIERAWRICNHRFDILGYRGLDYGAEIDWHSDHVHGKRAPRKPWFQIRYLDFAQVGDAKITWELNRHQHLVTLAKAFRLTGEASFAVGLFQQWEHWHRENPYPIGINWASSLEVAFRSLSWIWVYFLMSGSAAMPAGFRFEVSRKLAVSARHIEHYLSTYFSPNTHLLGEGVALFFIGTLFPELPSAEEWQQRGWHIVQQEAKRQVRSDGVHFEQSLYYHVYALDFFLHAAVLASLNEIAAPAEFDRTLERMLAALCVFGRSGPVPGFGDDDGGRLFDPLRNRTEHLLDPLATGAVLFGRGDFKWVAGGLREETLWLLGEAGMAEFDRLQATPPPSNSTAFQSSGLYTMAERDLRRQLVIDAGPQGADTAGHGHADALSIVGNVSGRALLIDPGTFEYVGKDSERDRFRGTKAHNTLTVDGLDQSEPKGPFSWISLPTVRAEGWITGETFDLFSGSHDGYRRLADPVVHRRSVFSCKSQFWLVRDQVFGRGKHQLDIHWHISPQLAPVEQTKAIFQGEEANLSILAPTNHGWSQEIQSEDWSPAYGEKKNHRVLRFSTSAKLPAEFVTLLIPVGTNGTGLESFVRVTSSSAEDSVVGYAVKTVEWEHYIFFAPGTRWTHSRWSSDAEFLYWGQSRRTTQCTLICCNCSYVEADGRRVMSSKSKTLRCEVIAATEAVRVISTHQETAVDKQAFSTIFVERVKS